MLNREMKVVSSAGLWMQWMQGSGQTIAPHVGCTTQA